MNEIGIDTHIWVYLAIKQYNELSEASEKAISQATMALLSAISCWEVALLVKKGRLELTLDVNSWISNGLKYSRLKTIDLTPEILVYSVSLKDLHPDAADRMIIATCQLHNCPLVTKDNRIQNWAQIPTIW